MFEKQRSYQASRIGNNDIERKHVPTGAGRNVTDAYPCSQFDTYLLRFWHALVLGRNPGMDMASPLATGRGRWDCVCFPGSLVASTFLLF